MVLTFVFFCLGGVEALMIRLQLGAPNNTLVTPQTYNQLFTMHGTTMVFLFVVPMMAGLANYFVPLMIGARDMAFPRLNALSFWLLLQAASSSTRRSSGIRRKPAGQLPAAAGAIFSPSGGQDAWIYLIHLTGISSIVGAINFYATIVNMRANGMTWGRLPLFCWAILTYSILLIFALPGGRRGGHDAAHRSPLRDALLRPHRGRLAALVAEPVLVLRPPRGLHPRAAGLRHDE